MKVCVLLASALLTASVLPAAAQSVKVSFHGGKVDLVAENATLRAILNEWARVGGTRIVNAERLAGPPVTVEFKDAYEQQAIEALLRGVSGYIVGPRPAGQPNASGFDRIVILATSTAPRPNPVSPVSPLASRPPGPQPLRRLPPPVENDQDDADDGPAVTNVPTPARPETPADLRRRLGQLVEAEPDDDGDDDAPAQTPAAPTNPFGVTTGTARPGVITPVPTARPGQRPAPNPATQP